MSNAFENSQMAVGVGCVYVKLTFKTSLESVVRPILLCHRIAKTGTLFDWTWFPLAKLSYVFLRFICLIGSVIDQMCYFLFLSNRRIQIPTAEIEHQTFEKL